MSAQTHPDNRTQTFNRSPINGASPMTHMTPQHTDSPDLTTLEGRLAARPRMADVIRNTKGMTLVEIMIVVTIMASIMGVVGFFVFGALDEVNKKEATIQIGNYEQLVNTYYLTTDPHTLPDSLEDLATKKRLAESIKPDPWGTPYIYKKLGGREFEIISAGPDLTEGTEDDISSKAKE